MTPRPITPPHASCAPAPDRGHAWETGTLAWDAFYLLVFVAVLIIVLVSTPGSTAVAGAAMGAMIAWYLFVGRPLWASDGRRRGRVRAGIYLTGLFALFFVVQSQNPEAWFLAFALSPQFFSLFDGRLATWLGIALNFLAAALLVYRYPTTATAAVGFCVAAAGGGFSIFYGGWVSRIIGQSAERAGIIDQLEATRAELAAAQHTAGRLAERQRLAADIHDTLAQGFASIVMLIQAAQADLDGSRPQAARHLELAARTARENLAEARALVAGLTPAQLAGGTLPDALRRLSQASGVDATFGLDGTPRPLPMAIEVVLLRVCQEALS
ncbi:MAG: putative signal transduction histidine kinase, partial [Actinomycetia bacterium]|nr:putative signal transduction histidine kinase [Actinomycetes bacterium]